MAWDTSAFDWTGTIDTVAQRPIVNEHNLLRNRLMAMEVDEKGQSLMAQKAKENYLLGYDPNKPEALPKPKNYGEFQAYQEIQAKQAADLKPLYDATIGLLTQGFTENRPDLLAKAKTIVEGNPQLSSIMKKNGMWSTIADTNYDPTTQLYDSAMYLDEEAIKKSPKLPPNSLPGYYQVKYTSPPGVLPTEDGKGVNVISVTPAKMTKDDLARRAARGDKYAAAELEAIVRETKDFTEPFTMQIGGKPVLVQRNKTTGEIKRLAEDKSTTVVVKGGSGGESADDFRKWTKEDKEWWFEAKKATGDKPDFGWGKAAAASRAQFAREYAQWAQGKGITGREAALGKEEYKADSGSLKFTTKQLDASKSFTKTIDNNINQLERHIDKMSKTLNLNRNRLLNMGTREFNQRLIGNANINIYDMLTQAISTENAKLQAGGAGSVAQVAEQARTDMKKIHDQNLPVSEMIKLMKATREEGGNRIKGLEDTRNEIKKRMEGEKADKQPERAKTRDTSKARTYLEGANGKADAIGRIRALAAKGWSKEELNEVVKGTKWE